ncbi:hypothetical protein HAX54_030600, partial [Datura stramonium]|nr:hypothetical protein [Datura stramonium]
MGNNWNSLCQACAAITMVKWVKPPIMQVKLNCDGSCIEEQFGGEGLVRDSLKYIVATSTSCHPDGNLVSAFREEECRDSPVVDR